MKKHIALESIPVIALILVAVGYRVIVGEFADSSGWLPNFSPMAALVLCGAVYLPRRLGLLIPAAILLFSDVLLNIHFNEPVFNVSMVVRYSAFGLLAGFGLWLGKNPKPLSVLTGTLAGSVMFYLVTNTESWLTRVGYSRTFAGWVQAMTTGLPNQPLPTWVFFRNSLISDMLFTVLILLCVYAMREEESEPHTLAAH